MSNIPVDLLDTYRHCYHRHHLDPDFHGGLFQEIKKVEQTKK